MRNRVIERMMRYVFFLCACMSVVAVLTICVFLFANGIPTMAEIGFGDFLLGMKWKPSKDLYGIFPMIVGSLYVTAGAILVGVPLGLLCAVFMARFCPKKLYRVLKPMIDLLAGIPSIVYGFFGLMVIVPKIQQMFDVSGKGLLSASILLGIMILPTIIGVAESAIRAVPESYYEGSLALGATHERSVFCVMLPAGEVRHCRGGDPRDRACDRRDHGRRHDCWQSGGDPRVDHVRRSYAYGQYRLGNGLCGGPAPCSVDRYGDRPVCLRADNQLFVLTGQTERQQKSSAQEKNAADGQGGRRMITDTKASAPADCINRMTPVQRLRQYLRHPGSLILFLLVCLSALVCAAILVYLIVYIVVRGVPNLTLDLFALEWNSENQSMVPALFNTVIMVLLSLLMAAPVGIFAAIYLVEYARRGSRVVSVIRLTAETLSGIPSIVYGLFGYILFVLTLKWGFSLLAGAITLAIMVLPTIIRTTEEALMAVPDTYREGSFGLGAGRVRTVFRVVLPSAVPGILAGIILAIGRIVGESAALIFTAGNGGRRSGKSVRFGADTFRAYVLPNERGTVYKTGVRYRVCAACAGRRHQCALRLSCQKGSEQNMRK